jgi:hypothetical protein
VKHDETKPSEPTHRSSASDRGSAPVIGDVLLVGVALLFAVIATITVLNLTGLLVEDAPVANIEFEYESDVNPAYADSFNTTNEAGQYDGLLTITHTHGRTIPAKELFVANVSSLAGKTSWAVTVATGDGPSYTRTQRVGASDRLEVWVRTTDPVQIIWLSDQDREGLVLAKWEH